MSFYRTISLFNVIFQNFLLLTGILTHNSFLIILYLFSLITHYIVKYMKNTFFKDLDINKRPVLAFNCNSINKGKDYSIKPGLPSGHTVFITFISFVMIYLYFRYNTSSYFKLILCIILLFQILVPISRVKINCHTKIQVYIGIILGILLSILFIMINSILMKNKRYEQDVKRILYM